MTKVEEAGFCDDSAIPSTLLFHIKGNMVEVKGKGRWVEERREPWGHPGFLPRFSADNGTWNSSGKGLP